MESVKEWFENFKTENSDKETLISLIEINISEQGFDEATFNDSIERNIKSIEKKVIQERFENKNHENKENSH